MTRAELVVETAAALTERLCNAPLRPRGDGVEVEVHALDKVRVTSPDGERFIVTIEQLS